VVDLVFVNEHTLRAFESLIRRDSTGNARGKREQMGKSFDGLIALSIIHCSGDSAIT